MLRFIKKHPVITAIVAVVAAYELGWIKVSTAQPQPQPQPPSPLPPLPPPAPPGPPSQGGVVHHVPIIPGPFTLTVNDGDTLVFQLPLGSQWNVAQDLPVPLYQTPGSVLGGMLSPLIPTGTQIATWSDVTGTGTIKAEWVDLQGQAQESLINVTAAGAAHTL